MSYTCDGYCYICGKRPSRTRLGRFCEDPYYCPEVRVETAQIRKAGYEMVMDSRRQLSKHCEENLGFEPSHELLMKALPLDGEGYVFLSPEEEKQLTQIRAHWQQGRN